MCSTRSRCREPMGVFLRLLVLELYWDAFSIPESWQATEEGYKRHQRHSHGEDDDVARESHSERPGVGWISTRHMAEQRMRFCSNHLCHGIRFTHAAIT